MQIQKLVVFPFEQMEQFISVLKFLHETNTEPVKDLIMVT